MTAVLPAAAQYRHGQDIGFEEDGSHEFKAFQMADPNGAGRFKAEGEICINIVGFLNTSSGGTLYLGVDDAGKVIGVRLNRHERDRFRQGIFSTICRGIFPPVLPDKLRVTFIAVVDAPMASAELPRPKARSSRKHQASSKVAPSPSRGSVLPANVLPASTATPSPQASDAEEAVPKASKPRAAAPATHPIPTAATDAAPPPAAVETPSPVTPHTAPAPAMAEAHDPDRDLFVVEIWVEPGLSTSQPVPYENSRSRAFLRLPGSTVVMTGGERIELYRRCARMDGPATSAPLSPRGRSTRARAAAPADNARSRTCALL